MHRLRFDPAQHEPELRAIIVACSAAEELDASSLQSILRRYPKDGRGFFSKSEIIRGFRHLAHNEDLGDEAAFLDRLRMKPVRTQSGVAPVTVLTKPFPCPGRCIFCPSDVRMPKSYLSDEPGAQRAAENRFDPYEQTWSRLRSFHHTGHTVDKVELIVLGGTWSSYDEAYQLWFLERCFEALNDWRGGEAPARGPSADGGEVLDFRDFEERVDGRGGDQTYNATVRRFRSADQEALAARQRGSWQRLAALQRRNESAAARCVGLAVETRPDCVDAAECLRLRRLGVTKVQLGIQSLDDEVLERNRRGHDVAAGREAVSLLRGAGFKLHLHWMPNLYGSTPEKDIEDFRRLFDDPAMRPDELKVYPCSLIDSAELMAVYEAGDWRPYTHDELLEVLAGCLPEVPEYCRVTRVIRDIPGTDIVDGNRLTNFREIAETELRRRGAALRDIRSRELRTAPAPEEALRFGELDYETTVGREVFLQATVGDRLAGFLRLSLPAGPVAIEEIRHSAMIREVHVYGQVAALRGASGARAQHSGIGKRLVAMAVERVRGAGYQDLAVISAVGTRNYYRALGFGDGKLYQHRVA